MCGITGIISNNNQNYKNHIKTMTDCLSKRGPDGSGVAIFKNALLGHRRLSIIDLATGNQPMYSNDKNSAVVFNGEIYGYQKIKKDLGSYKWKTSSDTEVILALYEKYNDSFTEKLPGAFSFAIWNDTQQKLIAGRDRFGEKPFYFAYGKNNEFIFASEIKSIIESGLVEPEISEESLSHYLHKLYVHPHKTIYKNIYTLPPAHILIFKNGKHKIQKYWKMPKTNDAITLEDAIPKFKSLLKNAVQEQMVADVPVSAFLSGGLDSTTIVGIASEINPKIETFSFGYEGTKNELRFANLAAKKYKTKHHELHDHDQNIAEVILEMARVYDEPFADSSNISTYLISKLTKKYSPVVLSGDGGDELLGGYYGWYRSLLSMKDEDAEIFPGKVLFMKILSRLALRINHKNKAKIVYKTRGLFYKSKYKNVLEAHHSSNVFFKENEIKDLGIKTSPTNIAHDWTPSDTVDDGMRCDIEDYMPGDILVKIDRASMANSLELRAPFLDKDFAEFAISLPYNLKINDSEEKLILRRAFEEIWPDEIKTRDKMGFGAPVNIWLEKPELQDLINTYLNDKNKKIFKYISFIESRKFLKKLDYKIWILLTLSIWMETHSFK